MLQRHMRQHPELMLLRAVPDPARQTLDVTSHPKKLRSTLTGFAWLTVSEIWSAG